MENGNLCLQWKVVYHLAQPHKGLGRNMSNTNKWPDLWETQQTAIKNHLQLAWILWRLGFQAHYSIQIVQHPLICGIQWFVKILGIVFGKTCFFFSVQGVFLSKSSPLSQKQGWGTIKLFHCSCEIKELVLFFVKC
jgi:hypothetical protein